MTNIKLNDQVSLSRIIHGHWRLNQWGYNSSELLHFIQSMMDISVTTFDHADIYGNYTCEAMFGEATRLNPAIRNQIQIVTKCGIKLISPNRPEHQIKHYDTSAQHIIASVEQSLKNFHTTYIDVLLIHRPDIYMNPEEVAEAFEYLHQKGMVLAFGVSNFSASQFSLLESYLPFPLVTNQIEVSPLQLKHFENGVIDQCLEKRNSPMTWSPIGGGKIFNSTEEKETRLRATLEKKKEEINAQNISEVIFAWLLHHPSKMLPIIGSGKIERVKEAVNALDLTLSREHWFEIYESARGRQVD
jgi:predicted oxidoreductase